MQRGYLDIGQARDVNSSYDGLNIHDECGGTATNIQLAEKSWRGSHALLFNAYKSKIQGQGDLSAPGNTKYANGAGPWQAGAGMIAYYGNGGTMSFYVSPKSTGAATDVAWGTPNLTLQRGGLVGIGTTTPTHELSVNGTIATQKVEAEKIEAEKIIAAKSERPCSVLKKDYALPTLTDVQQHIASHGHLPGIPSATDGEAGLNLVKMNVTLLQKVEELTLYVIQQNKEVEALRGFIDSQQQQIDSIEARIEPDTMPLFRHTSRTPLDRTIPQIA
ncbi:MAG: hypothetical protein AAF702_51685 [Chloroflexota bacterium]